MLLLQSPRKKTTLYPRDVRGCVLDIRANKANYGQPHTLTSGVSNNTLLSDMSVYRNHCALANLGATATSGHIRTPVLSSKGIGVGYTTLVSNGNFALDSNSDGLADTLIGFNIGTYSLSSGVQSFTFTSAGNLQPPLSVENGKRYYCRVYVKSDSNQVRLRVATNVTAVQKQHSGGNTFELLSVIATATATGATEFKVVDNRTSAWTEIQIKEMMAVDLSTNTQVQALESALGRNLIVEECDRLFSFTATSNSIVVDTPYSIALDGSDDYGSFVNSSSLAAGSNEIAIARTFRIATGATSKWMLSKTEDAENETEYGLKYNSTNGNIELWLEGAVRAYTAASSITQNVWYNVIFYRNAAGNIFIWLNKVSQTGADYVGALTNRANLRLNARSSNAGGTTHTDYGKDELGTQSLFIAASLDINKIIKSQMNISYDYTGVR